MQDVLLQMRYPVASYAMKQQALYGVRLSGPSNLDNSIAIRKNWKPSVNELIMLFFLQTEGLVEEWNIQVTEVGTQPTQSTSSRPASVFLRSFITLMGLSGTQSQPEVRHEFFFNAQNIQKRSDWAQPALLRNHEIATTIGDHHVVVNLAYQAVSTPVQVPPRQTKARERFLSDGVINIDSCTNNEFRMQLVKAKQRANSGILSKRQWHTTDSDCSSHNSSKQIVSLFSQKDDVEIISTAECAEQILERNIDSYEIQMIIFEEKEQPQRLSDRLFNDHFSETPERQRIRQDLIADILALQVKAQDSTSDLQKVVKFILEQ